MTVDAELAVLRARVAALEELADFFLGKLEGWVVSRKAPPGTPAFACARRFHPTWGCSSGRGEVGVSSAPAPLDRVMDEWIRFPGDVQGARG